MEVLTNDDNLKQELRPKGGNFNPNGGDNKYYVEDRIKELLGILEQMIDHYTDMKPNEGIRFYIPLSPLRNLEGFDSSDIAYRSDQFHSKGVELEDDGEGWVKFTRTNSLS
jgi:hypothetical protein